MADIEAAESASLETKADAGEGQRGLVKLWLQAIQLAEKDEEDWRGRASQACDRIRDEQGRKGVAYNILYANTETLAPALYNSTPEPDVRRRFRDDDPVAKLAAQVIERGLSFAVDDYDFDAVMAGAVKQSLVPGRAVVEVRYEPTMSEAGEMVYERVCCELHDWRDFLHGPAKTWDKVPWIALRYRVTREEAVEKFGKVGAVVNLDWVQMGADKDAKNPPEVFKRLTVWKIWELETRQVLFIAPSYKEAPLKVEADPLRLKEFFPVPRPLYHIEDPESLTPIVPYEMYRDQAAELDRCTARIHALINALKWRGIRPSQLTELDKLGDARDGDLVASEQIMSALAATGSGGLEKLIWLMPVDKLITVLKELVAQREMIKAVIFELSGVADIMRGETDPRETLGAQQIKAQWGSLRLQKQQREVARFARDILRLKAEIMAEHFSPMTLAQMSGINLPLEPVPPPPPMEGQAPQAPQPTWQDVIGLLRSDQLRSFRIDIETDSTIQADQLRSQEQMSTFVQGLAAYMQAVGPVVQAGAMPMDVATDILAGFSRQFKLGKKAEDALDRMGEQFRDRPYQPPDPNAAENARAESELQLKQAEAAIKAQSDQEKLRADLARQAADVQTAREKAELEMVMKRADLEIKRETAAFEMQAKQQAAETDQRLAVEKHGLEMMITDRKSQAEAAANAASPGRATGQGGAVLQLATPDLMPAVEEVQRMGAEVTQGVAGLSKGLEMLAAAMEMLSRPRTVVRGKDGKVAGVVIGDVVH